jgi:hypothetical protein
MAKNYVTRGQANSIMCHPTKKVNKAEELTYLSTNIDKERMTYFKTNSQNKQCDGDCVVAEPLK